MIEVVAALIWDNDRFMICQRPSHKTRALLWEFVGGKVENGESREDALVRECKEELGIDVFVDKLFMDVYHQYPDLSVHLSVFNTRIKEGIPQKLEHHDLRWITTDQIDTLSFCPADEDILAKIKNSAT